MLASIELEVDDAPEPLVMDVAQDVEGLDQTPERGERLGDPSAGLALIRRCMMTWAGVRRSLSDAAMRTS